MSEVSDLKIQNLQNQDNPLLKWFLEVEASLMKNIKRSNGYSTVEAFMKVLFVQRKLISINYFTKSLRQNSLKFLSKQKFYQIIKKTFTAGKIFLHI